ncbi:MULTISPECIES: glutamate synthase subunit beta [Arcicella]|uniref:Glutamate synthase subunit beta n=1 Tax=Arcicella aquatica TaxID=217141 RepID=A0ABU5QRH8_9BACT|nr:MULTISPECIES: glutamate synthase subunit beta [Arcicella]MDR6562573.1 glutamate synthase (NADPH/NADH) small chain [Arcicella sp. BE51]MDR6812660.1 glutamate synthase (NADPH/NADH) small chain [Arcicella sp. BE140]MDR6823972.1 glutamate synthase (NADPH/NADH) small chain [Arcicella sp. BE139]MEA5258996.1 glutamate synthase subunit beta [Arcicella aquatica]
MGKPTGFLEVTRETPKKRLVTERVTDYKEIDIDFTADKVKAQASRCMDCGVPFCHSGCPLGNIIPEFNDAVYDQNWAYAYEILSSTNNFPEFTGRICPAPCESACVLGINKPPVTIEYIEKSIIEYAFGNGLVKPNIPTKRTGKKVAVVGSGPAGMASAAQLNKAGHTVTVFERADRIGGLLRYGIPDFKLEKWVVQRRVEVMEQEGIIFKTNTNVGVDIKADDLLEDFDLVILSGGSTVPRTLGIPGADLKGIYPAMEFLSQQNKRVSGIEREVNHMGMPYPMGELYATDKNVVVIGGGDTGSDCVGTSNRHKAKSITQVEVMPMPPKERAPHTPWPNWPMMLRTSTSHEEGADRHWSIAVKEFVGDENGNLKGLKIADIVMEVVDGKAHQVHTNEREIPVELALIAAGFLHPQREGILSQLEEKGLEFDERGNVKAHNYQTAIDKVFAAGDMRRGQSLVVWAISEGREAARAADIYLMGQSVLEAKNVSSFAVV